MAIVVRPWHRHFFAPCHILRTKSMQIVNHCTHYSTKLCNSMMQLLTVVCRFHVPSAVYRFDFRRLHAYWIVCWRKLVATSMHPIESIDHNDYCHYCRCRRGSFSGKDTKWKHDPMKLINIKQKKEILWNEIRRSVSFVPTVIHILRVELFESESSAHNLKMLTLRPKTRILLLFLFW